MFKTLVKMFTPITEQQRFDKHMSQAMDRNHIEFLEKQWNEMNRPKY